jgi:hypothetical protein
MQRIWAGSPGHNPPGAAPPPDTTSGRLDTLLQHTERIVAQTRTRLEGGLRRGATRLVSLHDPDARPIVKDG